VNTTQNDAPGVAPHAKGCVISLTVSPRARANRIEINAEGAIRVQLTAPPVDGAANTSLLKFMAKILGVPRTNLSILAGAQSRHKRLLAQEISADSAWKELARAAGRES
jgi:uncharacterized protein